MKILHTSDWHLGQSFFTQNRKQEHQQFLDWLLTVVKTHQIDAIIVAGDIFDTGAPPSYAREIYSRFVVSLQAYSCTLVILGGNHDSVSVLNETRGLLSCLNTHVIASTCADPAEQVVEIRNSDDEVTGIVCAIPFIRARDVMTSEAGQSGEDKKQSLGEAIKAHYYSVYQLAEARRTELGTDVPIIATGHLTALGVSASSSVREIYIGTLDGFDAGGFPPADYIALGHIHRPQRVTKSDIIRYSGSPIPLSFDELGTQKQVLVVDFDGHQAKSVESVPVPLFQAMQVLRGSLDEIEQALAEFDETVGTTWLCIEVTTQGYLSDLHQRIQAMVENKPVEVLQLRRVHQQTAVGMSNEYEKDLSELSPQEVFEKRLELLDSEDDETRDALRAQFSVVVASIHEEQDA